MTRIYSWALHRECSTSLLSLYLWCSIWLSIHSWKPQSLFNSNYKITQEIVFDSSVEYLPLKSNEVLKYTALYTIENWSTCWTQYKYRIYVGDQTLLEAIRGYKVGKTNKKKIFKTSKIVAINSKRKKIYNGSCCLYKFFLEIQEGLQPIHYRYSAEQSCLNSFLRRHQLYFPIENYPPHNSYLTCYNIVKHTHNVVRWRIHENPNIRYRIWNYQ